MASCLHGLENKRLTVLAINMGNLYRQQVSAVLEFSIED